MLLLIILALFYGCEDSNFELVNSTADTAIYETLVDEQFESYDESIWTKSDWANGDPFYSGWLPQNALISDNKLTLKLTAEEAHDKDYASAEFRSVDTYMYGRYSARFKASDLNGTISSFFTYTGSAEGTDWDEIDVEIIGKDTTRMQVNYWRDGHQHPQMINLGFDAALEMHTYSFIFTQESISWYVDDNLVYSVEENNLSDEDSLPINAGKIIVNFWPATGIDDWSGHYDENTTSSAIYEMIKFEQLLE